MISTADLPLYPRIHPQGSSFCCLLPTCPRAAHLQALPTRPHSPAQPSSSLLHGSQQPQSHWSPAETPESGFIYLLSPGDFTRGEEGQQR